MLVVLSKVDKIVLVDVGLVNVVVATVVAGCVGNAAKGQRGTLVVEHGFDGIVLSQTPVVHL